MSASAEMDDDIDLVIESLAAAEDSATEETATTTTAASSSTQPSLSTRLRRSLGRRTMAGGLRMNPEAAEFVPTNMPTKRKASSSAKSGKSVLASSSAAQPPAADLGPVIRHDALFRSQSELASRLSGSGTLGGVESESEGSSSSERRERLERLQRLEGLEREMDYYTLRPPPNITLGTQTTGNQGNINPYNLPPGITLHPNAVLPGQQPNARPRVWQNGSRRREREVTRSSATSAPTKISAVLVKRSAANPEQVSYLPLCGSRGSQDFTIVPSHRQRILRATQGTEQPPTANWPADELPVEIFGLITEHLSRNDVQSMRLVNREFEKKVSRSLFHTSVVPFNTELYDMIDDEAKTVSRQDPDSVPAYTGKGKGRATDVPPSSPTLHWKNAKDDNEGKVYKGHGLRVFQGFGPHIKRFGMSFEVSEDQLLAPPAKKELNEMESYHGAYKWPPEHYARFSGLAGLEETADETSKMVAAFSKLEIASELALSIDSGLGWMPGPDKSLYAKVFDKPTPVFGSSQRLADRSLQAAGRFWDALQEGQHGFPHLNSKEVSLHFKEVKTGLEGLEDLRGTPCAQDEQWLKVDTERVMPTWAVNDTNSLSVLYTTDGQLSFMDSTGFGRKGTGLVPNDLRKEQKEWLLETEWAQRAFLESYMLAVIDNPQNFEKVTTLNIAKLSSGLIGTIARPLLWESLPSLRDVTIMISPDWRSIAKDDAGYAETTYKTGGPSSCVNMFFSFLRTRLAEMDTITKLTIGYVGGGEHAHGMYARNTNILPAPLVHLGQTTNATAQSMLFPHVEHLTLKNCWITPPMLQSLVKGHADLSLKKLTLDSVSLTAHPRFAPHGPNAGNVNVNLQQPAMPNPPPPMPVNWQALHHHAPIGLQQGAIGPQGAMNAQFAAQAQAFNQAQQQWQNFVAQQQQFQQHAQFQAPAFAGNFFPAQQQGDASWTDGHREGSWASLLNELSPGPTFSDYLPAPAPWDPQPPPRPETNLRELELKSCGYLKIQSTLFDQTPVEAEISRQHTLSVWFRTRQASLKPVMLEAKDRYMGTIVQYMSPRELDALQLAWGMSEGWDPAEAEEVEFDGLLPGGTGRFSGTITHDMGLVGERQNAEA